MRRGFCIITSSTRYCTPWLVQPLPTFSSPAPNCTRIAHRHTRATWMRLVMISFRDWHWLVTSKSIVIPYHLLTCRSFSPVYIQFLHLGLGHRLMKSTITTSAPSPYTIHSTSPRFSFSLTSDRPFSVRVDCVPIYIRISRFPTLHSTSTMRI